MNINNDIQKMIHYSLQSRDPENCNPVSKQFLTPGLSNVFMNFIKSFFDPSKRK
jgi:hypothetical protein